MISLFVAVSLGAVKINLSDTYQIITYQLFHIGNIDQFAKSTIAIVWNMRSPRVIMGLIAGAGLALCGTVMQTTVNNPISEPYILGISAGATFGATLLIILGIKSFIGFGAFIGAVVATAAVIAIASIGKKLTTTSLVLAGVVVNALFTSISNFIISVGANSDSIMSIKFWTMGSLTSSSWDSILLPFILVLVALLFFLTQYRVMNAMLMGDEVAITLGISLHVYRLIYMLVISFITGILVSSCGIIGFVGLITPHIARALVGTNHKKVLPISVMLGSLFIIWADVLARCLLPDAELPIGIFTALVGAPFFVYIVIKNQKGR
ncbi:MAG: iron ABC transporter permease [Atopobium minutum]|uniref:FecCD family ABC transporter permease n=1 Tax=Atopobium minutum TaxID=1381 RepID=UPI00039C6915|nr:iron ABC transporter permease [Atopobium minutum]MBS4873417.1 iron ABC transporter permease [Atopobium minutum]MDU5357295.1 iron ABC transporter permease [Atopobium minutum]